MIKKKYISNLSYIQENVYNKISKKSELTWLNPVHLGTIFNQPVL